jgi:DNA-binding transcriptional LysR family regulator
MDVYVRQGAFGEHTLKNVPFVVPVPPIRGAPSKVVGLDGWPDHLVSRTIRYRVTLMESALELCRQGLAAAFLPKFVVELHNGKTIEKFRLHPLTAHLPLPGKFIQQPVYLVKRKVNQEDALVKRIAKALRLICGS